MSGFIDKCLRTESTNFTAPNKRLLHAAMGMQTEAGEFTDALKKHIFYGKELDTTNLKEELGDLLWYMAIAMDELGTTFSEEERRVLKKLAVRYPERFEDVRAEERDLGKEREVLEDELTYYP